MVNFRAGTAALLFACTALPAATQQCTTQSQMRSQDKTTLVQRAMEIAGQVQSNNAVAVRQQTVAEVAQDFSGFANTIASLAPHLQGASFQPESLWILDGSTNSVGPDGKPQGAQFFCNLNGGSQSVTFSFQALPPGRYGMAVLDSVHAAKPYQLALLLREESGTWKLAGFFPRATAAGGHDGVWYWKSARAEVARKQNWIAWLQYSEAERLLRPAGFVSSSHLELLQEEQSKAAPTALANSVSESAPLIVKAKDGGEYRVTALGPDDSLGGDRIDVAMHYVGTQFTDPVAARAQNRRAASALVDAYPELRDAFHGVWVYADAQGSTPFASEEPMAALAR